MLADFKKMNTKIVIIIALCTCLAVCAAGVVYTYLNAKTDTVKNTFVPAKVSCEVEEAFENGVKSDVKVKNTGNVDAFIRAYVVVTFVDADGKVLATAPKEDVDYSITYNKSTWEKGSDGFWYYKNPVAQDESTQALIQTASVISAPDGYRLNVQIIASAIQSAPNDAVQDAWGVTVLDGKIVVN